ncbi:exodeoxyribonuclease VII large subunit [Candidatus Sneabacter namystus]|uniref:Exodeoxyribonuclease 7 large subunit n=1 Tax=Candidatus Sneabacter namystus TaxID=2601646 RepID=A0A5C0UJQ8_9RICK|nr:exodeoxyribonuclease VII large subunit [Candidatus Sneabacter namystus]QEK39841.1 exodeoxyribonuclease VII large subunit [Candidatus Sneabacter namystus]
MSLEQNFTDNVSDTVGEYTVTQFTRHMKSVVESQFSWVKVSGEISGFKVSHSGHAYFNLKDDKSIVACTCWSFAIKSLNVSLEDGMQVLIYGKVSIYGGQSKYQINVASVSHIGKGDLMQQFQLLKQRLQQEGLFLSEHKKKLPAYPQTLGIVTSMQGAVLQDMLHRVQNRYPVSILLYPVAVQGVGSAGEVEKAINVLGSGKYVRDAGPANEISVQPDLIIVARGGGSIEDLWSFNDEKVVRAIFASEVPVVSAIGHETDFVLSDFVADVRAPTPTAAIEMVLPVLPDLQQRLTRIIDFLRAFSSQYLLSKKELLCAHVPSSGWMIASLLYKEQRLDELYDRIIVRSLRNYEERLSRSKISTALIFNFIKKEKVKLQMLYNSLCATMGAFVFNLQRKMEVYEAKIHGLDVNSILKKGFILVKDQNGNIISSAARIKNKDYVNLVFADGVVLALCIEGKKDEK